MGKCSLEIEFKTELFVIHRHYLASFSEQVEKIISELLLRMPTLNLGLVVANGHYLAFIHRKNAFCQLSSVLCRLLQGQCPEGSKPVPRRRILIRHTSHQMAPSGF